jgi:hypothetical protein
MIVGYGICTKGESKRYLKQTLECFKSLCDDTIILLNNAGKEEKEMIDSYGFKTVEDNREWGNLQHRIKEDFMIEVQKLNPLWCVCLDMDEVLEITRPELEKYMAQCDSMYVYILNLWGDGWKRKWSFWNVRVWKWNGVTKFANRPLHCGLAPEWAYHYGSYVPIVLRHYGLKDKRSRTLKIKRYEKYDPKAVYRDSSYYEALKDDSFDVLDIDSIQKAIEKEALPIKRKNITFQKESFYLVEKDGRTIDIPEKHLVETLKRGFKLVKKL